MLSTQITKALKEWNVAVNALFAGETIILLRKGGIRENAKRFEVPGHQVLLYPTFEHQDPNWVKSQYVEQVQTVESGWRPEQIAIRSWAEITGVLPVLESKIVENLLPFHIWNQAFVSERLKWKPHQPLSVLLLRVYQLPQVILIPYQSEYGGCRSWIDLAESIEISKEWPVIPEQLYTEKVAEICRQFE